VTTNRSCEARPPERLHHVPRLTGQALGLHPTTDSVRLYRLNLESTLEEKAGIHMWLRGADKPPLKY